MVLWSVCDGLGVLGGVVVTRDELGFHGVSLAALGGVVV